MLDHSRSSIFKVFKIQGFIFIRTTRYGAYSGVLTHKTGYLGYLQRILSVLIHNEKQKFVFKQFAYVCLTFSLNLVLMLHLSLDFCVDGFLDNTLRVHLSNYGSRCFPISSTSFLTT